MVPELTLNNGVTIPALGFGVFQSAPDDTVAAVLSALETGYRHIDTAAAYGNEREVGEGIRRSGVPRDDVFIETKVWVSDYGYAETLHAFDKAVAKLGVGRLDLLILHQPAPDRFERTIAAYTALERLLADGKVRAIGVSNFMPHHLASLLERTEVVPAINQIELHPLLPQDELRAFHAEHGILTEAWSPLARGGAVLADPVITGIAERVGKTPAQVILRWHLELGNVVIPKSVTPSRIVENLDLFDFSLTAEDLAAIAGLATGDRIGPNPDTFSGA